jgi:MoaA/NifB/PqqE/SkfB family radical SAM enzyme
VQDDRPPLPETSAGAVTIYFHLDIVARHATGPALSCVTGWLVAEQGFEILAVGLRFDAHTVLRCNFPFHRGDVGEKVALAGKAALIGFNLLLPARLAFAPERLEFVVVVQPDDADARVYAFTQGLATGRSSKIRLADGDRLSALPAFTDLPADETGALLEERLFGHFARERRLTLRLDLINKCNLRCVMCHYSNEDFARRPVQRITPEQFFGFFDTIAPFTRDVVLSCGDEPLMTPHFEPIMRQIAARDPEVRIRFCTNGMLLSEKLAEAVVAANVYMVMFSFDGVESATLHRIRVGADYRRIVKNIVHLQRLRARDGRRRPRFVFNYVMFESNLHEAPAFVQLARRLGADYIDFRHVVPFDFYDIEHEMLEYFQPKYDHYRARIAAAAEAAGLEIYIPPAFGTTGRHDPAADPRCSLDEFHALLRELGEAPLTEARPEAPAGAEPPERIHEYAHLFCDRPFSEVMIQNQRDVYPCPWHREKLGVLDGSATLEEIFFGENFRRVRRAMLDPRGAPGCSHCPIKTNHLPTRLL